MVLDVVRTSVSMHHLALTPVLKPGELTTVEGPVSLVSAMWLAHAAYLSNVAPAFNGNVSF